MSDRVDSDRMLSGHDLEDRLRDVAETLGASELQPGDFRHLARVLSNTALMVTPVFELIKFADLIDAHFHPGALRLLTETAEDEETLHRLLAVPDHVRILGDKCLFETGVAQRSEPASVDFEGLGRKAYAKASRILGLLSQDSRLRSFYDQNVLNTMSIEEEIAFLLRCGELFPTHVRVLHALLACDKPAIVRARTRGALPAVTAVATEPVAASRPRAALPARQDSEIPRPARKQRRPEPDREERGPDLHLVARNEEDEEQRRFRELMAAEKAVLFSALDTELLREELKGVVMHQDGAIDSLCDELALYSTGTQDPRKPTSYFLVGPTGVGKNYMVESMLGLFERLWGIEVPYLELEGPEFTYPSDINELKGAARGFIRSDEEGIMTQFYKRCHDKPFSVILVDEIEKAHPQLRRFFLPIMDRGTMMDNRGKVLHFSNTMIFFTSNIGYSDVSRSSAPIGYGDEDSKRRTVATIIDSKLRKSLSPEFINRIHVIRFEHLDRDAVTDIFQLEMDKIRKRYAESQGIQIEVTEAARAELIHRGYSREYGARNLSKVLARHANIEVSKLLKRDEDRGFADVTPALSVIREMREGKRQFDAGAVRELLDEHSRIRVPYRRVTIDCVDGELTYDRG